MAVTYEEYSKKPERKTSVGLTVAPAKRQAFIDALNKQFPGLEMPEERQQGIALFASQADPKGNVTMWKKTGKVQLTGALTSLVWNG